VRDNENVITYDGVVMVGQCEENFSDSKVLRHVATATKFWSK